MLLMLIAGVNTVYANSDEFYMPKACDTCTTFDKYIAYYSHCGKDKLIKSVKTKPQIANRYRMLVLTRENKLFNYDPSVGFNAKKAYTFAWVDTKTDKVYSLPHVALVNGDAKSRFIFKGKKACFSQK